MDGKRDLEKEREEEHAEDEMNEPLLSVHFR